MNLFESIIELLFPIRFESLVVAYSLIFWSYQFLKFFIRLYKWAFGMTSSLFPKPEDYLAVSKIEFIRQIVFWCGENLGKPSRGRKTPNISLNYYRHKKLMGIYVPENHEITIYWGSHWNLLEIINTVIHEYQHFLDIRNKKDLDHYAKELESVGYTKNHYERRARKISNQLEKVCLKDLRHAGIIKKSKIDK